MPFSILWLWIIIPDELHFYLTISNNQIRNIVVGCYNNLIRPIDWNIFHERINAQNLISPRKINIDWLLYRIHGNALFISKFGKV